MNLEDARRVANDVLHHLDPSVRVVAATAVGGADYTEIVMTVSGCRVEPCTIVLGVDRSMADEQFKDAVADGFHRHRRQHG